MKYIKMIVVLMAIPVFAFAQKDQDPDTLVWSGRQYTVAVDRNIPSVVTSYFMISGKPFPFHFWSNTNSRGHVATLEIVNNKLCISKIEAKRFRTRIGNLWTESGIDTSAAAVYFGIVPINPETFHDDAFVVADWFSGILELNLIPRDKKEQKTAEANGTRFLYVKEGIPIDNLLISDADMQRIQTNPVGDKFNRERELMKVHRRYTNFYRRCAMDREHVTFDGHEGLFEQRPNSLTLIMQLYGNDALKCPSNWQWDNSDGGAPFGTWVIRNDSLFLTSIATHRGDSLYKYESSEQFVRDWLADSIRSDGWVYDHRKPEADGSYFADWINGDYVIHYGDWQTNNFGVPDYVVYKTQRIRFASGAVTSSQFSPRSFEDDEAEIAAAEFKICNEAEIWSVDDKQLAEAIGNYKPPKKAPSFKGDKAALRTWFLSHPLTDERAIDRLSA